MDNDRLEILKELTEPQLNTFSGEFPDRNDFTALVKFEGKDYRISWFKDVNVHNPIWQASAVEVINQEE